jgi:hypothetical protein
MSTSGDRGLGKSTEDRMISVERAEMTAALDDLEAGLQRTAAGRRRKQQPKERPAMMAKGPFQPRDPIPLRSARMVAPKTGPFAVQKLAPVPLTRRPVPAARRYGTPRVMAPSPTPIDRLLPASAFAVALAQPAPVVAAAPLPPAHQTTEAPLPRLTTLLGG